jgi:hypothetical protein
MTKVWKILALLVAITVLVWLTTLWRWQTSNVDPSGSAIALNLLLLPLGLTMTVLLAMWSVRRLHSYASAPLVSETVSTQTTSAITDASERSAPFIVLASGVELRSGGDWNIACSSIESGECKAELDSELKDDDGIAVFTARIPEMDTDAVEASIAELVEGLAAEQVEEWASYKAPTDLVRVLSLLIQSMNNMQTPLEAQWEAFKNSDPSRIPTVTLSLVIPARWPAPAQRVATAWLTKQFDPLLEAGLQAARQSRAMARSDRPAVHLQVHAVASAEDFWSMLDQKLVQWQRDDEAALMLVMAADSRISEEEILRLSAQQTLFSGVNPLGLVPGEGAASLLLASSVWPQPANAEPAMAHMHRASLARRDKSADASGRLTANTLQQVAEAALKVSRIEPTAIMHLTTDADHRGSRTGEVYGTMQELLPHLDAATDGLRAGVGCGDLGIVRLLACAALSASKVADSQTPALVLGVLPAFERFAVVLTPPSSAPSDGSTVQPT